MEVFTLERNGDTLDSERRRKGNMENDVVEFWEWMEGKSGEFMCKASIFSICFLNHISCLSNLTTTFWIFPFRITKVLQGWESSTDALRKKRNKMNWGGVEAGFENLPRKAKNSSQAPANGSVHQDKQLSYRCKQALFDQKRQHQI